jgi:hypothetical protein
MPAPLKNVALRADVLRLSYPINIRLRAIEITHVDFRAIYK